MNEDLSIINIQIILDKIEVYKKALDELRDEDVEAIKATKKLQQIIDEYKLQLIMLINND